MQEIGGRPDARFCVENTGNVIDIRVPAETSAKPVIEVTMREQAFAPLQRGLGYIRVKGITFQHAGNGYPPPQRGWYPPPAGTIGSSRATPSNGPTAWGWISATGLRRRRGEAGASQIVRGNTIRYCGVEGLGGHGHPGRADRGQSHRVVRLGRCRTRWEAAGAKFHGARNLLFRHNVVRHIRHANALWLDSGNTNCRITGNVMADILTVSAAIHMEMDRNYNQIDNNIVWDVPQSRAGHARPARRRGLGHLHPCADRVIVAQNLYWPLRQRRDISHAARNAPTAAPAQESNVYNNIFTRCGKAAIVFINRRNEADGNVFASLPDGYLGYPHAQAQQWLDLPPVASPTAGTKTASWLPAGGLRPRPSGIDDQRRRGIAELQAVQSDQ